MERLEQAKRALQDARHGIRQNCDALGKRVEALWAESCEMISTRGQCLARGCATKVALASLSRSSGFQPLFSVAMGRDQLKAQLSSVPVYAVANKKDEYVLLSPKGKGPSASRVGLMFMSEEGARKLIQKLKKENPKLGKVTKVVTVGLDDVFDLMQLPAHLFGLEGVTFRLVPDIQEVANALEVFRSAGVPARSITGVPIFQAEGLSVMASDNQRATPLFLSKTDLDIALKTAGRNQTQQVADQLRNRAAAFNKKAEEAWKQVDEHSDPRESKKWQRAAEKAQSQADTANQELDKVIEDCPNSRVEVGSLEDVIDKMGKDKKGTWSNVVFVRPGVIKDLRDDQPVPAG